MAKTDIYKITILDWDTYSKANKRYHGSVLIPKNLHTDYRIIKLNLSAKWLYLTLILECSKVGSATIQLASSTLSTLVQLTSSMHPALMSLEQNQLVTVETLPLNKDVNQQLPAVNTHKCQSYGASERIFKIPIEAKTTTISDSKLFEKQYDPEFQLTKNWLSENKIFVPTKTVMRLVEHFKTFETLSEYFQQITKSNVFKTLKSDQEERRYIAGAVRLLAKELES